MKGFFAMSQCQVACDRSVLCFSFNYNLWDKLCELLGTDMALQGLNSSQGSRSILGKLRLFETKFSLENKS